MPDTSAAAAQLEDGPLPVPGHESRDHDGARTVVSSRPAPGRAGLAAFVKPPAVSDADAGGHVLVIMNDLELGRLLFYCLTAAGFRARLAGRDADGRQEVERAFPDVVLLDSKLPNRRSTDVWRQIRLATRGERAPAVIMFISDENDIDPRLGLEFGPCDFVVYPLSVRDLVLRIDRNLRLRRERTDTSARFRQGGCYRVGPLELDLNRQTVKVDGATIALSPTELRVLTYVIEHGDRVCTRADLLADVWGYRSGVTTRATDIHVNRLRTKLGAAASLIETLRGSGYRLSAKYEVLRI